MLKIVLFSLMIAFGFCPMKGQDGCHNFQSSIDRIMAKILEVPTEVSIYQLDSLIDLAASQDLQDTLALLHHKKGVVFYFANDYTPAILSIRKAIDIRLHLGDTVALVQSYYNLAKSFEGVPDRHSAIKAHEKIIKIGYLKAGAYYIYSLQDIGILESELGDYERAIRYLTLAKQHLTSSEDEYRLAGILHTFGVVFNQMLDTSNAKSAISHLHKAGQIFKSYSTEKGQTDYAASLTELGNAHESLGQFQQAINYFKAAKAIQERYDNKKELSDLLNNIGVARREMQQYELAKSALKSALDLQEQINGTGLHPEKASIADNKADIFLEMEDYEHALEHYQKAIRHVMPSYGDPDYRNNPDRSLLKNVSEKESLLNYLSDKAKAFRIFYEKENQRVYLKKALETLELADHLIDLMRREHRDQGSKYFWRKIAAQTIYESALEICHLLQDEAMAFFFFEKSKAILLQDAFNAADARQNIPDSIAALEMSLNGELFSLQSDLNDQPRDLLLLDQILDKQSKLRDLDTYLQEKYPSYYDIRYSTKVIALTDMQKQISNTRQAFIHYFYGNKHIYLLIGDDQNAQLIQLRRSNAIEKKIFQYQKLFQTAYAISNDPELFAGLSHHLYQELLQPALDTLQPEVPTQLIIFADGPLHNLPFATLLTQAAHHLPMVQMPYLIREAAISYGYSGTVISRQAKIAKSVPTWNKVLGIAPFASNKEDPSYLGYSGPELTDIAKYSRGSFYYDSEASSQLFQEQAIHYPIIHLSTHANAGGTEAQTCISFSKDSLLLSDLYAAQIPANLVVLSACQTRIGEIKAGEGVMSLARGFTYAGASSLIASSWNVNDQSTVSVFNHFYHNLAEGKSKVQSLHLAQLAYLEDQTILDENKSPYYWAGFSYIGSDGVLQLTPSPSTWKYVLGLCAFLFVAIFVRKQKKSKEF